MSLAGAAGLAIGVVLLASGALKLFAPAWPEEAAGLGAPRWTIPVVPWVELALGSLLAAGVARPVTGTAAALVLLAFTVLLVRRLREGRRAPCACFGSLSRRPIGWGSVVRNLVLIGLAVIAAAA